MKKSPMTGFGRGCIRIRGARQNNLQGVDLDIPVGGLVVVTGLSGAGKSSLVFDTLHAEGQRRYVETFSSYTRQFLDLIPPPKVDSVENIRPSIAVRRGGTVKTSRSTVGTMTGLCDWFKVWFAHNATLHDPETGLEIHPSHPEDAWERLLQAAGAAHAEGQPWEAIAPGFSVTRPAGMEWAAALAPFIQQGYTRGLLDGVVLPLDGFPAGGDAPRSATLLQDRIAPDPRNRARFLEAAAKAFQLGRGRLRVAIFHANPAVPAGTLDFDKGLVTPSGRRFAPAAPAQFSFNSPLGACPECNGFGRVTGVDWAKIIPDPMRTLADGAIAPFQGEVYGESQKDLLRAARRHGIPTNVPWDTLTPGQKSFVTDGEDDHGTPGHDWRNSWYGVKRFFGWLESSAYKMHVRVFLSRYRSYSTCQVCGGKRLKAESLCWRWKGLSLPELYAKDVSTLLAMLRQQRVTHPRHPAEQALEGMLKRLSFLEETGLGYLSPDRLSRTLSGGESQRVNLVACLGSGLADTLFVLDEPSVGMHPGDLERMNGILRRMAAPQEGNTVVVVEHDESVMRAAGWIVEIGPRPGADGGRVVFSGPPAALKSASADSATAAWLLGRREPPRSRMRPVDAGSPHLRIKGIHANNLRDLALDIPLGRFTAICGVSGSGKSTLLNQVLAAIPATPGVQPTPFPVSEATFRGTVEPLENPSAGEAVPARFHYECDAPLAATALVDQSPASRTPRSNAALHTGAWEAIRELLAGTPDAVKAGLSASHFSFNSGEGRCPHCGGSGWESVEMQFLANIHLPCPVCEGSRFRPEILRFQHRGKSVADILSLTVAEALRFFADEKLEAGDAGTAREAKRAGKRIQEILRALGMLAEVGLHYLTLGQPLSTLSGGEAQRLKLARFLGDIAAAEGTPIGGAGTLILLDEPTTGLHREDVAHLAKILQRLVDAGNTLVVIEHNIDILRAADWLLELGPGAGEKGGKLVAAAPPSAFARLDTPTSPWLRAVGKKAKSA
ncbi:MAG: excinuclease ABC subunit UvrA [Puniceicoccales bacterium]|nr:excinuclease ABC subunit UvrA [Puniceicoccales bacterium]